MNQPIRYTAPSSGAIAPHQVTLAREIVQLCNERMATGLVDPSQVLGALLSVYQQSAVQNREHMRSCAFAAQAVGALLGMLAEEARATTH